MSKKPKILFYDIETKPILVWTWNIGNKVSLGPDNIVKGESFDIICICYKWAHENKVHSLDWGNKRQDSTKMIEEFGKIYNEADVAVAYNGDKFDLRHINAQRLLNGQEPLKWIPTEDPLKQLRKYFYLPSYRLAYVSQILADGEKDRMGFQDWIDIVKDKCPKAMKKMIKYCKQDVRLLDKVYKRIAPYVEHRVNKAVLCNNDPYRACKSCGSSNTKKDGIRVKRVGKYQRYKCNECAHNWHDSRKLRD